MTQNRYNFLRRLALGILINDCEGFAVLEQPTLFVVLNQVSQPVLTVTEFEELLSRLEKKKEIVRVRGDEGLKARITDDGRAAYAQ